MKIREVTTYSEKIYEAIAGLLPQLDTNIRPPAREYLEQVLRSESSHFIIGELENNEIAGFLVIVTYPVPTGIKAWVEDVVVDEALRGKGYGMDLMQYAIDYARSAGAEHLDLTSRPWRIAANRLYQKLGFALRETNVYRYNLKTSCK
jgi:ribosomal protein S18 acetylase RimI-like enzyme